MLKLDHLYVVCHGSEPPWPLAEGITAFPAGNLCRTLNVPSSFARLARRKQALNDSGNVFAVMMEAARCCSLGPISNALYLGGGQYRRRV